MFWTFSERLGPICLMAVVLIFSRVLAQRSHRLRLRTDAQRLRCALCVSLKALRSLYENNLHAFGRGESRLVSGRSQINLFRTQLGRLISLEEREIEAVLAACIAAEGAETAMAVAGKALGVATFMLPDQFKCGGALKMALAQACSYMVAAERLIAPQDAIAQPAAGYDVHSNQIASWKTQLLENAAGVFRAGTVEGTADR